jgi:general secretion pathway protein H
VNRGSRWHVRRHGFTLLELLVVMLIATTIMTLVPPLFSSALPGTRVRGAAHDLAAVLRHTRNQAIIHNTEVAVRLDSEPMQYRIADGKPHPLPSGVNLRAEPLSQPVLSEAKQHVLWFFPDGSSSGADITLSAGRRTYRLHIDWLSGRTRMSEVTDEPY